jgi:hypothetical protein
MGLEIIDLSLVVVLVASSCSARPQRIGWGEGCDEDEEEDHEEGLVL